MRDKNISVISRPHELTSEPWRDGVQARAEGPFSPGMLVTWVIGNITDGDKVPLIL